MGVTPLKKKRGGRRAKRKAAQTTDDSRRQALPAENVSSVNGPASPRKRRRRFVL